MILSQKSGKEFRSSLTHAIGVLKLGHGKRDKVTALKGRNKLPLFFLFLGETMYFKDTFDPTVIYVKDSYGIRRFRWKNWNWQTRKDEWMNCHPVPYKESQFIQSNLIWSENFSDLED